MQPLSQATLSAASYKNWSNRLHLFEEGLLDESPEEQTREPPSKKEIWMEMPARPTVLETSIRQTTRLKWKEKGCSVIAPIGLSDDDGNLIYISHWYDIYRRFPRVYLDTPSAQIPMCKSNADQEETHMR